MGSYWLSIVDWALITGEYVVVSVVLLLSFCEFADTLVRAGKLKCQGADNKTGMGQLVF